MRDELHFIAGNSGIFTLLVFRMDKSKIAEEHAAPSFLTGVCHSDQVGLAISLYSLNDCPTDVGSVSKYSVILIVKLYLPYPVVVVHVECAHIKIVQDGLIAPDSDIK